MVTLNANAEEQVTWEQRQAMSQQLLAAAEPMDEQLYASFGKRPGVYVITYTGHELGGSIWEEPKPTIVYVGHNGTDSYRHWDDNTGISTVRRSLAAMLSLKLDLIPIANTDDPEGKDRYTNYRLNEESEAKLSAWMHENLRVAFLDLPKEQVEPWYLALIDYNIPMFNFQNNPRNDFGRQIKNYRLQMAELAAKRSRA